MKQQQRIFPSGWVKQNTIENKRQMQKSHNDYSNK